MQLATEVRQRKEAPALRINEYLVRQIDSARNPAAAFCPEFGSVPLRPAPRINQLVPCPRFPLFTSRGTRRQQRQDPPHTFGIASFMAGSSEALLILVFPLLHVAVGIGVTYGLLARMVNRTTLRVDPMRIEVHHGPLFWPGPAVTPTQTVDQLYVVQGVKGKEGATGYSLVARLQNRTSVELVKGVPTDLQARYIEQRLESWMGIDDVAVEGEYSG